MSVLEQYRKQLLERLDEVNGQKILVVGDVCLDEYVMGSVHRISPEAPVPVVEVQSEDRRLGLSANVAQNISSLGGKAYLVGVVGEDKTHSELKELLDVAGVSSQYLLADSERPTTRKMRVMTGHHHVVRVDYERRHFLSPQLETALLGRVKDLLPEVDAVVIQDYAKGVVTEKVSQQVITWAKAAKKQVLVDPHRLTPLHFYKGADLFKPNRDEAYVLAGIPTDVPKDRALSVEQVGQKLLEQIQCQHLIITRGKDGMTLFSKGRALELPTYAQQVFDVAGAGDTVVAALALGWVAGFELDLACILANYAAGVVVGKVGCVPCPRQELLERIQAEIPKGS